MKNYFLTVFFVLCNLIIFSQSRFNGQWAGIDYGMMTTNRTDEWKNKVAQSSSFSLNLYEHKFPIFKQYLGLTTGFGFNFKSYFFDDQYTIVASDSTVGLVTGNPTLFDPSAEVKSSNLNLGFFQVPLLLDFATKKRQDKSFYMAVGVVGGRRR